MLTVTCIVSLPYVDARSLRKVSPLTTSRDSIVKRSADEVSRRRTYSPAGVLDLPVMVGHAGARSSYPVTDGRTLLSDDERLQFASMIADALLRHRGNHPRQVWTTPDDEDLMRSVEETAYGREDGGLPVAGPGVGFQMKRTIGHLRSPRELHPVYLGLGQDAASAALNTYASLLADEKRRESLQQQQQGSANPVRFIGKR